jgi:6-phosphogluconate dehydrogenase
MEKFTIGLIGLATMGANLARNLSGHGIKTVVFNRTFEKTQEYIKEFGNENLGGREDLKSFVESLENPRKIILLVKAGEPVDEMIQQLKPLLQSGDSIIDCGNSNYGDTIRRAGELEPSGIHFVGCGISGGEEGALHGPSLMPGSSNQSWNMMQPLFEKIAAKDFQGNPCVTHVGEDGAGHYVKMVHNGIEYAVMQVMSEAYDLLRKCYDLKAEAIADIFEQYNKGTLESYLFEISVPVLRKKDEDGKSHLIDALLDKAGQKGTGKWTAIEGLDRAVGVSSISEAVFARVNSGKKDLRKKLSSHFPKTHLRSRLSLPDFTKMLEKALYASLLSIYAQGFELIKKAANENSWNINLSEIARIWQGGCIIRARMLQFLTELYKKTTEQPHLFEVNEIQDSLNESLQSWRDVVSLSIHHGIPTPGLTSALQYLDTLSTDNLPANLIQGLRDYFGAHTYERNDRPGVFHTDWLT